MDGIITKKPHWKLLHWLGKNLGTMLVAFALAIIVWVSAVMASDPDKEMLFRDLPVEITGMADNMMIVNQSSTRVNVTLYAPESILSQYANNLDNTLKATVDISGLDLGSHKLPINVTHSLRPTRLVKVEPSYLEITLDRLVTRVEPIRLEIIGKPARGYQVEEPILDVDQVTLSGASTAVNQVVEIRAILDVAGKSEPVEAIIPLRALDNQGQVVNGVELFPKSIRVRVGMILMGGYRNQVVRVVTIGQVTSGYRISSLNVTPANVLLYSSDPETINKLPGYVETTPLDLSGVHEDLDVWVPLNLPAGVSVVGDQNVLVQVKITPIESSIPIELPLEIIGLAPEFSVEGVPKTVDVILAGPLPVLDSLASGDVRALLDLTDLEPGTYQLSPLIEILPSSVVKQSVTPDTIEITILPSSTTTPASLGQQPTATPIIPAQGTP